LPRGNAYYAKKDYDRAIADYSEALRLDPTTLPGGTRVVTYNNRCNAYADKKDYAHAIADYGQAIGIDPKNAGGFNGRCYNSAIALWVRRRGDQDG
jgi:tetratricopeptide (TPR) repeat protein